MIPLVLEEAIEDDAEALADLERACHSHPWTRRHFVEALRGRPRVFVLRRPWSPGDPRRGVVAVCVTESAADEVHVHDLAVEPSARRTGLGRWLLGQALRLAARGGARTAWLEVRERNAPALALYAAAGFLPAGRRRGYYQDPAEDALVLRATLADEP